MGALSIARRLECDGGKGVSSVSLPFFVLVVIIGINFSSMRDLFVEIVNERSNLFVNERFTVGAVDSLLNAGPSCKHFGCTCQMPTNPRLLLLSTVERRRAEQE